MKTTKRLENAITKLYNAFHNGTLNAFDCSACAVGNLVGDAYWTGHIVVSTNNPIEITLWGGLFEDYHLEESGYTKGNLMKIEFKFLTAWKENCSNDSTNKDIQFQGLCSVVEYLCELDNIPNVMDYTSLFEFNEKGAVNELI